MPRSPSTHAHPAPGDAFRKPVGTLTLNFDSRHLHSHVGDRLRRDVSAVAVVGRTLFAACDETATVERLLRTADGNYHQQETIPLADFFDLPAGPSGEMDIEALAIDGGFLWIAGSHSLKRDRPGPDDDNAQALDALADIDRDPNRTFLGRLPIILDRDGTHRVAPTARTNGKAAGPACLKMKRKGRNKLTRMLRKDPHLGPSLGVPSKENGFDIEGLAVRGERLFLGLRGPVLSGRAIVVELRVEVSKSGRLKLRKRAGEGRRTSKHFLPLDGLGIRDLLFDGDDLLLLAGPTMSHDAIGALFRWRKPLGAGGDRVHGPKAIERLMDLTYARESDQAEGIAFVQRDDSAALLVVYDNPSQARLTKDGRGLIADLFDLPR